jgi:hypothetical protein
MTRHLYADTHQGITWAAGIRTDGPNPLVEFRKTAGTVKAFTVYAWRVRGEWQPRRPTVPDHVLRAVEAALDARSEVA